MSRAKKSIADELVEAAREADRALSARLPSWQLMQLPSRLLVSLSAARGRHAEPVAAPGGAGASAQKTSLVDFLEEAGGVKYSDLGKDSLHALCLDLDLRGDGDQKSLAARLSSHAPPRVPDAGQAAGAMPGRLDAAPRDVVGTKRPFKAVDGPAPGRAAAFASKRGAGGDEAPAVGGAGSSSSGGAAAGAGRVYTEAEVLTAIDARRVCKPPKLTNACAIGQQLQGRPGWPDKATRSSITSICEALLAAGTLVRFERPGGKRAEYRRPGDTADAGTSLPSAGDDMAEYESSSDDDDGGAIPAAKKEELEKALTWAEKQDSKAVLDGIVAKLGGKAAVLPSEKACIALGIVYLGDVYHTSRTVTSARMRDFILRDARKWTPAQHGKHKLKAFFEPLETGGYQPKRGHSFEVDHIIPQACGGIDHPRNYAVMASRLNARFQEKMDEKLAIVTAPVRRQVLDFAQGAKKAAGAAVNAWIGTLKPLAGAERVEVIS